MDRILEEIAPSAGARVDYGRPRGLLHHGNPFQSEEFIASNTVETCLKGSVTLPSEQPIPLDVCVRKVIAEEIKVVGGMRDCKELNSERHAAEVSARLHQPTFCLMWAAYGRPDRSDAPVLVPHLRNSLSAKRSGTRAIAVLGLGHLGEAAADAIPDLQRALHDKNPAVRLYAAQALWRVQGKPDQALPVLAAGLKDEAAPDLAAMLLGEMGAAASPAVPALGELTRHKNEYVRAQAMYALGRIGPAAAPAVPALCQALEAPENKAEVSVRVKTVHADGTSESRLLDRSVYSFAVHALGDVGPGAKDAIPALLKFRNKTIWFTYDRAAAEAAIKKIEARPLPGASTAAKARCGPVLALTRRESFAMVASF
jgi:HEAT repeat protein